MNYRKKVNVKFRQKLYVLKLEISGIKQQKIASIYNLNKDALNTDCIFQAPFGTKIINDRTP